MHVGDSMKRVTRILDGRGRVLWDSGAMMGRWWRVCPRSSYRELWLTIKNGRVTWKKVHRPIYDF